MGRSVTSLLISLLLGSSATLAQAQRPGPGERYEPGVELLSFAAPDGRVRVWYVLDTLDAVPGEDTAPADGVPDYVADVAAVADESHRLFVDALGFRAPVADTDLLPAEAAGGDERLDIYLLDFGEADGAFHAEACTPADAPVEHCTGYMLVENDFAETSYPSLEIAVRVVVSHEYFHAVQNAYDAGQDIKWSEGSAVWAEELAYPEQDDYEIFVGRFLEKTFRPFDRPSGATFGDPYPYGAALWPTFLTERYGPEIVRRIWEACEGNVDFVTATAGVLEREHGVTLEDAWLEFTHWNLFTGERADPDRAYDGAAVLPSVFLEAALSGDGFERWHPIEGLSARYVPVTLPDVGGEPRALSATAEDLSGTVVTAFLWDGAALSQPMPLVAGDQAGRVSLTLQWEGTPALFVVLTGITPAKPSRRITLGLGPAVGEPPDAGPVEPPDAGPGGSDAGGGGRGEGGGGGCQLAATSPASSFVPVLAGLAWLCLRRRRPGRRALRIAGLSAVAMLLARGPAWAQADSQAPAAPSGAPAAEPRSEDGAAETSAAPDTEEEPSRAPSEQPAGAETEEEPSSAPHGQPDTQPVAASAAPAAPAAPAEDAGTPGEIIVITGSRVERPLSQSTVATEVITRQEIESSGATNVAGLLGNHPGLEIVQGLRGSGVRMQGLDSEYVAVLVDGRRVIGRIDGVLDLEGMAVGDVERVEIVKGPSSALYGSDALAGVIHIITRKPDQPITGEAKAQYGSFGALDLYTAAGSRTGAWRGRVSAGLRQGDGYDLSPDTTDTTASAYEEKQVSGQAGRALGALELSVSGDYLRRDLHGVDSVPAGMVEAVFDIDNVIEQAAAALDARWQPSETGRFSSALRYSLYRDQFLRNQRGSAEGDRYDETIQHLAELAVQHADRLGASHDATAGLEATVESLSGERIGDDASERYRVAVFAQDDWRLADEPFVRLAMGGRLDVDSRFGAHATPKVALRWDPEPRVTGRVGYGWGFRAPDFKELYLEFDNSGANYQVRGNPDLAPETSQSVNAGIEVRVHRRVWASVSGYYNDIDDLIDFVVVPDEPGEPDEPGAPLEFTYGNVASAYTRGVETHLRVEPLAGLSSDLSYTFTDTRDRENERPLDGRARHQGTIALAYQHDGTQAMVRTHLVGRRRFFRSVGGDGEEEDVQDEVVVETADRYVALDARVSQRLLRRVTLFVGASNLLDAGDARLTPIAPRTFYGGAQVNY
jgi:outer membrane receptor for ferrienterochelin and colicins